MTDINAVVCIFLDYDSRLIRHLSSFYLARLLKLPSRMKTFFFWHARRWVVVHVLSPNPTV